MDQGAIWYGGVLDGDPALPPPKGHSPQFSVHVCCGQAAGWIKMPLGREVVLGPVHIVLDGEPASLPKGAQPPNFRSMSIVTKRSPISATADICAASLTSSATLGSLDIALRLSVFGRPFVKRFALCYRTVVCLPVLSVLSVTLVYCGQTVAWIRMPLGIEVGISPSHIVLDGDPALQKVGTAAPRFSAHVYCDQTVAHLSYC